MHAYSKTDNRMEVVRKREVRGGPARATGGQGASPPNPLLLDPRSSTTMAESVQRYDTIVAAI